MTFLRWSLLIGLVLGAMVTASLLSDPQEWKATVRWAEERAAQWQRARCECPVLQGQTSVGSSLAGYGEAARLAGSLGGGHGERLAKLLAASGAAGLPTDADRAAFAAIEPAVTAMREAAHRPSASGAAPHNLAGAAPAMYDLLDAHRALLLMARVKVAAGDPVAAVQCWLDGLACGVDLTAGETPLDQALGAVLVEQVVDAVLDDLLKAADPTLLTSFAAALAAADRALDVECHWVASVVVHMVQFLRDTADPRPEDIGLRSPLLAWRHGFSLRRSGIARAVDLVALVQRFERESTAGEPWPSRRARLQLVVDEDRATNRDMMFPPLTSSIEREELRRGASARLRLLRLAVAFHLGNDLPRLADPMAATTLTAVVSGDRATFTSQDPRLARTALRRR